MSEPSETRPCQCCNGTGKVEWVDLGDGVLRSPKQAKARIKSDKRIEAAARRMANPKEPR